MFHVWGMVHCDTNMKKHEYCDLTLFWPSDNHEYTKRACKEILIMHCYKCTKFIPPQLS